MSGHLNDDQLLGQLYGIFEDPHVDVCPECSARLRILRERRVDLTAAAEVLQEALSAQRRQILARLDRPGRQWTWIPAAVAASIVAIGLAIYRPTSPTKAPAQADAGDDQLFSEVYSMSQSTEPRAAAPIHALFEDNE